MGIIGQGPYWTIRTNGPGATSNLTTRRQRQPQMSMQDIMAQKSARFFRDIEIRARLHRLGVLANKTRKPTTAERLEKLFSAERQEKKRKLDARLKRLLNFQPARLETLDSKIEKQIRTQPAKDHSRLRKLFGYWTLGNAMFFDGKLKLPIIAMEDSADRYAACSCDCEPTRLYFSRLLLPDLDERGVYGSMLHEMCHQYQNEIGLSNDRFEGHCEKFAAICSSISKHLGWQPVSAGALCARWPL